MQCRDLDKLIDAYLDRELRPEEAERFERHLDACETCGRQYRPVIDALNGAEELPVPAGLRERVLAAVVDVQMQAMPAGGLRYVDDAGTTGTTTTKEYASGQPVTRLLLGPSSIGALAACIVLAFSALLVWQIRPTSFLIPNGDIVEQGPRNPHVSPVFAMAQAQAVVLRGSFNPAPVVAQTLAINRLMQPPEPATVLARRRSLRDEPTEPPPAVPEITILITGLKPLGV